MLRGGREFPGSACACPSSSALQRAPGTQLNQDCSGTLHAEALALGGSSRPLGAFYSLPKPNWGSVVEAARVWSRVPSLATQQRQ